MEPLSAVTSVISIITGLINVAKMIQNDEGTAEKLNRTIIEAWKVLDMVVDSQFQGNNKSAAFEDQAKTLIKWCYDAEDLLDTQNLKAANPRKRDVVTNAKRFLPGLFGFDETGKLLKGLNEMVIQWKRILTEGVHQTATTHQYNGNYGSYLSKSLIGRTDDIKKIVQKLLSCDRDPGISITGMCGLGKSSLARNILKNEEIVHKFCTSWVDVSDGIFVWDDTRKVIFKELPIRDSSVGNKHILIVFDNLLYVEHTEWHKFWCYKEEQKKESKYVKIIITTHNLRIPKMTHTIEHSLEPLSDYCCEQVIKKNAKLYEADLSGPRSSQIVKSVAKRCEGLPSVAELFGIVLAGCNDGQRDMIGKEEKLWHTPEFQSEILPKLLPSYRDIKSELRRCLAYFSLFPDDHQFSTDELAHLFVGECFLQSYEATSSLKQIGENCVHDLEERSILQSVPSTSSLYKLQCFGQEFAKKAALGTCMHQVDQGEISLLSSSRNDTRHLSISWQEFNHESWSQLEKLRKLRTFLSLYAESNVGRIGKEVPSSLYKSVSYVRVLSLKRTDVEELPSFINRLRHLRYLDISYTLVAKLPKEFSKLYALQFLKIKNTNLSDLPKEFHKLINLRYVDWEENNIRNKLRVRHIGKLFGLESLPLFDIGEKDGYRIRELKDMNYLQGSICIENLQLVNDRMEAEEAMLHKKSDLERIVLQWKPQSVRNCALVKDILTGLRPPHYLKELKLINYGGENLPNWIIESIIEKVHLMGCCSCYLPALAKMRNLKTLVLQDMENITQVSCRGDDDAAADTVVRFPLLKSLEFHNMTQLEDWTILREDMPHLRQLRFFNCPKINSSLPFVGLLTNSLDSLTIELDA